MKIIIKKIIRIIRKNTSLKKIKSINTNSNNEIDKLLSAIINSICNSYPHDEEDNMIKIEKLRTQLNDSRKEISIEDFGAGSINDNIEKGEGKRVVKRTLGEVSRNASKPKFWCILLYNIIKTNKPKKLMELGTCLGISGSYQATAANIYNPKGDLYTFEGSESLSKIACENFKNLDLNNVYLKPGIFNETIPKFLNTLGSEKLDYIFIDGHHDEIATLKYFELFKPYLSNNSILIFDDINWSEGMKNAWNTIMNNKQIIFSLDLNEIGICVFSNQENIIGHHNLRLV